ncbi:MAG: LETM1 domain-containing protein ylh47 [Ramalina farinacea]|uniref:LETM1 domain-containing protein ylh47 n=1 Tax=Ramalina farinacea TaxID=258253 RepID=A0AA43QKY9_9LECA|nr:LETM1 domain-containing protein ylh47 [Ramalina farinacea]
MTVSDEATLLRTSLMFGAIVLRPRSTSLSTIARAAYLAQHTRALPSRLRTPATSALRRYYATETSSTGDGSANFPPPGFNTEQAKKPLPAGGNQESIRNSISSEATSSIPNQTSHAKQAGSVSGEAKTEANADHSLAELAADKAKHEKSVEATKAQTKLTIWQKVKKEAAHYWDGTKLLGTEVRISFKLALKMAAGYELSRREHRQLQRTTQDLGRLVPFSVFVIVPFAELLLPVALKVFPNMLPSTYEGQKSKDAKATSLRSTRSQVSSFLRETLKETGLPVSAVNAQKEEFTEFFRKVRATGESPTQADVVKVCKIFKDDLTLDNLSRPQLVGMAKYMNLNAFGTDMMLRYQVRHRMRQIKRDDRAISYEGVDSLSVPELQMACASRGLRTHGLSPGRLREDLQMWLDLRLKYGVPSTLLVLSNAFMYTQGRESEVSSQIDALQAVLSSIPEELFHEIELEVHNAEGAATNRQRLEVLKEQQDLIEEENEQNEGNTQSGRSTPKDTENIDEEDRKASGKASKEDGPENEAAEAEKEGDAVVDQPPKQKET